jgi:hypothetical protein
MDSENGAERLAETWSAAILHLLSPAPVALDALTKRVIFMFVTLALGSPPSTPLSLSAVVILVSSTHHVLISGFAMRRCRRGCLAAILVILCCATCPEGKRGKAGRVKTKRESGKKVLSRDQVETFKRDGVLVFEGALSQGEINEALSGLHSSLERSGILVRADDGGLAITPNSAARMQLGD